MESLKEPMHADAADDGYDNMLRGSFRKAQAISAIDPRLTFEQWLPPEVVEETDEEFLQSLRDSVAEVKAGVRNGLPADILLEEWRREIERRDPVEGDR